ncbi:MAG: hypothetical protein HY088_10010 [Ignavibacteriales bacterium]|nr:hypothetical protein [Ignavibacteriales bacterium]
MTDELRLYWEAVQKRICAKCIDGSGNGNCRLSGYEGCGLTLHFPKVVETILSVNSDKLESYIQALRLNVCSSCKHQSPDGTCLLRDNLDCGLDRYFPMVIEAIEEVRPRVLNVTEAFGD